MQVQVRFFAITRERAGVSEASFEVEAGATLGDLWALIAARYPALAPLRPHLRLALELEYVSEDTALRDGAEVALIPPVAGGSPRCTLTEAPIDPATIVRRVERPAAGAIATFQGVVRDHAHGKAVTHLEYEVYPSMALAKLREVAAEAEARWPACQVAVEHRVGRLEIGETAVLIAVSSPHRGEAFEAVRYTIDRIKEVVPIWKKEFSPDGSVWVGLGS